MSVDAVLALVLFLAATWLSLLGSIITVTRNNPGDHSLFVIAAVHFVVLLYFALASSVLYGRGIKETTSQVPKWLGRCEELLTRTWPAAVLGTAGGFALAKLTGMVNPFVSLFPVALLLWWFTRSAKGLRPWRLIIWGLAGFMPYMFLMSWMWADVAIQTDREIYKKGDSAVIAVRSEGYVFNPNIKDIEIFGDSDGLYAVPANTMTSYFRVVHLIRNDSKVPELQTTPTYIMVSFEPQASWFVRKQFHELAVIP